MPYVDAFVLVVPKQSLEADKAVARIAGGALWGAHLLPTGGAGEGYEIIAFSWIVYESRQQRSGRPPNTSHHGEVAIRCQAADLRRVPDFPGALAAAQHLDR